MKDPLIVTMLTYKYARLKGELERHEAEARALMVSLDAIEHVVRLYRADWSPRFVEAVRPRKAARWRYSVVGVRTAFEVLKRAERPLSAKELAARCVELADEPVPDKVRLNAIANALNVSLHRHVGISVQHDGARPRKWFLLGQVKEIEGWTAIPKLLPR